MPNLSAPKGTRYTGWFKDMVNNQLKYYLNGTLVSTTSGNDVTFADAATATGLLTSNSLAVVTGVVSIDEVAYVFPADNGDSGEQLQTDGSGVLTWEASGV